MLLKLNVYCFIFFWNGLCLFVFLIYTPFIKCLFQTFAFEEERSRRWVRGWLWMTFMLLAERGQQLFSTTLTRWVNYPSDRWTLPYRPKHVCPGSQNYWFEGKKEDSAERLINNLGHFPNWHNKLKLQSIFLGSYNKQKAVINQMNTRYKINKISNHKI